MSHPAPTLPGAPGGAGDARPTALVLANRLPFPLDDGWKVRTYHVLRGVATAYATTLVVFDDGRADVAGMRAALGVPLDVVTVPTPPAYTPANLVRGLVSRDPVHVWNLRSPAFAAAIRQATARRAPDVCVAELAFLAPYLDALPRATRRVIDTHNIDSVVMRRYSATMANPLKRAYALATSVRMQGFERRVFPAVDQVWVCSEPERVQLAAELPAADVRTIPNGVDTERFGSVADHPGDPDRLLFFGKLDYFPNSDGIVWFAREILPRIRAARPGATIDVVGLGATPGLREAIAGVEGLNLVGSVPDVRAALAAARVAVVPLRAGGGTRLKILEALAAGRPIVSTTVGAEGLGTTSGVELVLADEPEAFAAETVRLLADPAASAALAARGRAFARAHYDWRAIEGQLVTALSEPAGARGG